MPLKTKADFAHIYTFFVLTGVIAAFFGPCCKFKCEYPQDFDACTCTWVAAPETGRKPYGKDSKLVV